MSIFVAIENMEGTNIYPGKKYQLSAFRTFMSNKNILKIEFNYPNNINFNLQKFNTSGLKGDYNRFCVLETESGEKHILSDNKSLLKGYVGWKNRMTYTGLKYKKSTTKKRKKSVKK